MIARSYRDPTQVIERFLLPDGRQIAVRPILPQDAEREQVLVRGLSREERYHRFFNPIPELSPQWLEGLTRVDHEQHVALVAEGLVEGQPRVAGEARYVVDEGGNEAEFAVMVAAEWRRQGVATRLIEDLCTPRARSRPETAVR